MLLGTGFKLFCFLVPKPIFERRFAACSICIAEASESKCLSAFFNFWRVPGLGAFELINFSQRAFTTTSDGAASIGAFASGRCVFKSGKTVSSVA